MNHISFPKPLELAFHPYHSTSSKGLSVRNPAGTGGSFKSAFFKESRLKGLFIKMWAGCSQTAEDSAVSQSQRWEQVFDLKCEGRREWLELGQRGMCGEDFLIEAGQWEWPLLSTKGRWGAQSHSASSPAGASQQLKSIKSPGPSHPPPEWFRPEAYINMGPWAGEAVEGLTMVQSGTTEPSGVRWVTVWRGDLERGDRAGGGAPAQEGPDEQCDGGLKQEGKGAGEVGRWTAMESQSLRLVRRPSTWGGKVAKMEDWLTPRGGFMDYLDILRVRESDLLLSVLDSYRKGES